MDKSTNVPEDFNTSISEISRTRSKDIEDQTT